MNSVNKITKIVNQMMSDVFSAWPGKEGAAEKEQNKIFATIDVAHNIFSRIGQGMVKGDNEKAFVSWLVDYRKKLLEVYENEQENGFVEEQAVVLNSVLDAFIEEKNKQDEEYKQLRNQLEEKNKEADELVFRIRNLLEK